jgi:hypothetical protein
VNDRGKVTYPDGSTVDLGELLHVFPCACGIDFIIYEFGIMHRLPYCEAFRDLDPPDYIRHVRRVLAERRKLEGS